MIKEEKDVNLINYSHDRAAHYKVTADEIFNLINKYTDQEELAALYNYFEKKYQLPVCVVKQEIRQSIARSYLFKIGKFNSRLRIKNIPKSILQYGALVYALFFTKSKSKVRSFKLIIDYICSPHELKRFEKILNLVGKDKVLCIARNVNIEQDFPSYHIYNRKLFRDINLTDLLKSMFSEFFVGIWVVLRVSIKTKVNLFPTSLKIIHSCLSFKSLFESNKAQYMIQERHYDTSAVKNHLFKELGGIAATSIQKNIFQIDPMFFYIDIDVLYSLGNGGYSRALEYGGRIDCIKPVGSLFMEYYWFSNVAVPSSLDKKYDVIFLGINLADRMDSYNKFLEDYYSSFKWLVRLKRENPNYRVGIIHHVSLKKLDLTEEEILLNSGVEIIDKAANSYAAAFSSHCAVTYGSTMGYELNAHKLPTFFIDPDYRCTFLPNERVDFIDKLRMKSYDNFSESVKAVLMDNESKLLTTEQKSKLCLNSAIASDKIYKLLQ